MTQEVVSELAPTGVLRAAINMGNFLLVTGRTASGDPEGVAPDMAREIASRLGVPVAYVPYARPGELADAAGTGIWEFMLDDEFVAKVSDSDQIFFACRERKISPSSAAILRDLATSKTPDVSRSSR